MLATACIEDSFSTSPSEQPEFSTDTLSLGTIFTDETSPTAKFLVHNRYSKGMNIQSISLSGADAGCFRLNVDGVSGTSFENVEIRAKDSIFVLVEARLPEISNGNQALFKASLDFKTNGVNRSLVLEAEGQNVTRLRAVTLDTDTRLTAERPYVIYDSLVVAEGAKLEIEAGSNILFHDKATLVVHGSLQSNGEVGKPVVFGGDRTGNVVGDISFDIMSGQWGGVVLTSGSYGHTLRFTDIKNTNFGFITHATDVKLINCRLHNSAGTVLQSFDSSITAAGCEFAEAGEGLVDLHGGNYLFNQCTFANNYLFSVISGPAIDFNLSDENASELHLEVTNSIIAGLGKEISADDITGADIRFNHCLFRSEGSDDDNFIECVWGEDPLFYTVRSDYFFDYRLQPDSPAIGAGDASLVIDEAQIDWFGNQRGDHPDLGAYVFELIEE